MSALPATVLASAPPSAAAKLAAADWPRLTAELDARGHVLLPALFDRACCRAIATSYDDDAKFRSRVVMSRHGFGRGEYRYFSYPLSFDLAAIRAALYAALAPLANRWHERMKLDSRFPPTHAEFLARCHAAAQTRPTPLLLKYGAGDYNCLHRDLYGEHVFPIQMAVLLSAPGTDFAGGEFVLTEQRPRMQSRVDVVPLAQGDAVLFAVSERPVTGSRGDYRVTHRHGVSRVLRGDRHTLGVILHDAA
ncbi:MAG TPA: 2OG-Fe(II) oxygenase [Steroidobacteraceae bacterium]|nr:2OG-Fe(II) oxygenase [Steroidobacteraceae bacterium]